MTQTSGLEILEQQLIRLVMIAICLVNEKEANENDAIVMGNGANET
jgi:hypothetical protein